MENTYEWHASTEIPEKEGRYLVTDVEHSVCIAFYGKYRDLENYNDVGCEKKYCAEEYVDSELEPISTGWYFKIYNYDDMDGHCLYDIGCDTEEIIAWTELPEPFKKEGKI